MWQGRLSDGRLVALKVLHPAVGRRARRRLLIQARRTRAVRHPRVLAPLAVDPDRARAGTVLPWVAARDLGGRLIRHGRPGPDWAAALGDEIGDIVAEVHRRGFTHGRLTADHVLLDEEGRPVLTGLDPTGPVGMDARRQDRRDLDALRHLLTGTAQSPPTAVPALDLDWRGRRGR